MSAFTKKISDYNFYLTLLGWLWAIGGLAQPSPQFSFQYDQSPAVILDGRVLPNPWAGGLNACQFSTMRLNGDEQDDLVVFDRTTNKLSTFLATPNLAGGFRWQYAPIYETAFPRGLAGWVLLVDFDGDGHKDLFTSAFGGIAVYHNDASGGVIRFSLRANQLMSEGYTTTIPLFAYSSDLPAITDYDDDGDIDIITFDPTGNIISYQQNMSVERTGRRGLDFKRYQSLCWGHFRKEYCNDFTFGFQCPEGSGRVGGNLASARPMHTGNTLTVVDTDGDQKKDLLFGFVSCENIARLRNAGTNDSKADFISYDSLFPASRPILFPAFPATFWEDGDGDGIKDLLASPNVSMNENQLFDFKASNWFYKNQGTNQKPDLHFKQTDFLQQDMLDLGEGAAPALADLDGDGDFDLLVGYSGIRNNSHYRGGIWQFENIGTTKAPSFSVVTTDYLAINESLSLTDVKPSFVDIDGNGSMDLILAATGEHGMEVRALLNTAPSGGAARSSLGNATLWAVSDRLTPGDLITVADIDRDGKPDVLISKEQGTIEYFRNVGTALKPLFQLQNQTFGGFTNDDPMYTRARSIVIADLNGDHRDELVLAAANGSVRVYGFPEPIDQSLTLVDSLTTLGLPGTGLLATAADLDGDGLPDLMLGSSAGGIRYLRNTSQRVTPDPGSSGWVFPNPTRGSVTVRPPYEGHLEVYSLLGQLVQSDQALPVSTDAQIDLSLLPNGLYILRFWAEHQPPLVEKVLVIH